MPGGRTSPTIIYKGGIHGNQGTVHPTKGGRGRRFHQAAQAGVHCGRRGPARRRAVLTETGGENFFLNPVSSTGQALAGLDIAALVVRRVVRANDGSRRGRPTAAAPATGNRLSNREALHDDDDTGLPHFGRFVVP